ncbi:MAG: histidine kinase [Prevotellaceae bacterium]|jgi:LytS/YehU family sensor histidine kinase|nr:histidine kinase [Prevotellaceae bacterium]
MKTPNTYGTAMNYRSAVLFALAISLTMHVLSSIMFFYRRGAIMPGNTPMPDFDAFPLLISTITTFLFTFLLYLINFALLKLDKQKSSKMLLLIGCMIVATTMLSWIFTFIHTLLFDYGKHPERAFFGGLMRDFSTATIVFFSSQIVYANARRNLIALENEALKAENEKTRYEALRQQVNPHFLFNSLNTLNAIIKTDPNKAQQYVQELSYIFRYTLQNEDVITLDEELKFTETYGSLMQIRYGSSLQIDMDVRPEYRSYHIIPLSLQTLVENAIKHNIISRQQPLAVRIFTEDSRPAITVSNPLQQRKTPEDGEGVGLANLAERYRLKWQQDIAICCTDNTFSVTIPLKKI